MLIKSSLMISKETVLRQSLLIKIALFDTLLEKIIINIMKTKNSKSNLGKSSIVKITDSNTNRFKRKTTVYGIIAVLLVVLLFMLLAKFEINFNYDAH